MTTLTEDEVIAENEKDLKELDPNLDVKKGPLRRFFIAPLAKPVLRARNAVDRLIGLFTLTRLDNLTETELETQVAPFSGMTRFQGEPASGFGLFYCYSDPNRDIVIHTGDQVADSTGALIFIVTQDVRVKAGKLKRFFNPVSRRYEIPAPIQALEVGDEYSLPANGISKLLSPIQFITGVTNYIELSPGTNRETNDELDVRFRNRLDGSERGTQGGLITELQNIEGVKDIALITASDTTLFSRRSDRPIIDAYVIGSKPKTATYPIPLSQVDGMTSKFPLPVCRILSISAVKVTIPGETESVDTSFNLIEDSSSLARSVSAQNFVEIASPSTVVPPPAGSTVLVDYTYDSLLDDVQTQAGFLGSNALFDTDILAYAAIPVDLNIEVQVGVLSSFSTAASIATARNETIREYNKLKFIERLNPEDYRDFLKTFIPAAASITLSKFQRADQTLNDVGVLTFARNEYPVLKLSNLLITDRS